MKNITIAEKDLAVIAALKPFLSTQGQDLVEFIINVLRLLNASNSATIDTEALQNLLEIMRQK
ncbi:MAG: hypothetical protein ACOX3A_04785 [bacterium]|jgi:hypothetical protein